MSRTAKPVQYDTKDAQLAAFAKAMGHPVRIRILRLLNTQACCYTGDLTDQIQKNSAGKWANYNYYDGKALTKAVEPVVIASLRHQIAFGLYTNCVFCRGSGNNYQ